MFCKSRTRNFAMWAAIAIGITAASMSASKHDRLPAAPPAAMTER